MTKVSSCLSLKLVKEGGYRCSNAAEVHKGWVGFGLVWFESAWATLSWVGSAWERPLIPDD